MSKFKLIEGEFTVAEARELIGSLLEYKIQFHNKENFSSEIRSGLSDERSIKRREELLKTKEDFLEQIAGLNNDKIISINADINIADV